MDERKNLLEKYTLLARDFIYNPERMREFLKMLGNKHGTVVAVQTVMDAIHAKREVPPEISPLLAINIYMTLVDQMQLISGKKVDPKLIDEVVTMLLQYMKSSRQGA